MPKGASTPADELVKKLLEKQKERIRQIQQRDREKLKRLNALLAKQKAARRAEAGAALEKLYKEQGAGLDIKKVITLCEKYWPMQKDLLGTTDATAAK
jgi:hypothetical protein